MDDHKIFNNSYKIFDKTGGSELVKLNSFPRFSLILEHPENIIVPANRILVIKRKSSSQCSVEILVSLCDS